MLPINSDKAIDIVELAVYSTLTLPAIYNLFRHGAQGILGWFYIITYCMIRLVAAGLKLQQDQTGQISSGAMIVDNIGLSPLLLGAAGILHEARYARGAIQNSKIEWIAVLQYHILVSAGLALIAVSISDLVTTTSISKVNSDMGLLKGGFVILFVAWVALLLFTLFSLRAPTSSSYSPGDKSFRNGTMLLNAVLFSLPMTLLRAIYGAVDLFGSGSSIDSSSFSSSVAAEVCLALIPPILATIVFVTVGVLTPPVRGVRDHTK